MHEDFRKNYKDAYLKIFRKFPNEFPNQEISLGNVIKLQHYGIPTGLLDVTFNPLVALFFTLGKAKNNVNGGFYAFAIPKKYRKYISDLNPETETKKEEENGFYLIEPPLDNPRIKAQNGAFFCNLKNGEIDNDSAFTIPSDWEQMKIEIPNGSKEQFLRKELSTMNISYETIFPELEMVSRDLKLFCQN